MEDSFYNFEEVVYNHQDKLADCPFENDEVRIYVELEQL